MARCPGMTLLNYNLRQVVSAVQESEVSGDWVLLPSAGI